MLRCATRGVVEGAPNIAPKRRHRGYWDQRETKRAFLDGIAKEFNIKDAKDWRRVGTAAIVQRGGAGLLNKYPSFLAALQDIYPEEAFDARDCRSAVPNGYWDCRARRKAFFDGVAARHSVRSPEDWKGITTRTIIAMKGAGLLQKFQGSLKNALADAYPGVDWLECRPHKPAGHWEYKEHRKAFFDSLATKLNVTSTEDWGRVSRSEVEQHGGGGLLATQYDSLFTALADVYPSFSASAFRFMKQVPPSYWDDDARVVDFVKFAEPHLNVSRPDDWYRVGHEHIAALAGGRGLLTRRGRLGMLRTAYPTVEWREGDLTAANKRSTQFVLIHSVSELFKGCLDEDAPKLAM